MKIKLSHILIVSIIVLAVVVVVGSYFLYVYYKYVEPNLTHFYNNTPENYSLILYYCDKSTLKQLIQHQGNVTIMPAVEINSTESLAWVHECCGLFSPTRSTIMLFNCNASTPCYNKNCELIVT